MPFTVITLKNVPNSLRGDLSRWMQEIATGVYVGNLNSRIREYIWKRVTDSVGNGEATLSFSSRNEIGYSFCSFNTERQVIDYDGIPLVLIPSKQSDEENKKELQLGFSNASKYHQARRKERSYSTKILQKQQAEGKSGASADFEKRTMQEFVFLDIETTGLDADTDQIIEVGAVKVSDGKEIEFHRLINTDVHVPEAVQKLTGITDAVLKSGVLLEECLRDLYAFIQGAVLVGYNLSFDIKFLNRAFEKYSLEPINNKTLELMYEAKKRNSFQVNYKFETTLKEYRIDQIVLHRALDDAKLMYQLFIKMGFI